MNTKINHLLAGIETHYLFCTVVRHFAVHLTGVNFNVLSVQLMNPRKVGFVFNTVLGAVKISFLKQWTKSTLH